MGSGSLAAMAVFEARYKEDMSEEDAIILVRDSIRAGIFNDLGSGSNVDITIIRKDDIQRIRTYENAAGDADTYKARYERPQKMIPPQGATMVISESFKPHTATVLASAVTQGIADMDLSAGI
jgi:20S proteasome subunit beta 2